MVEKGTRRTVDATLLNIVECLVVDVRVVEHGFGRYAPDIQAGSTKCPTLLYTCSLGDIDDVDLKKARKIEKPERTLRPS